MAKRTSWIRASFDALQYEGRAEEQMRSVEDSELEWYRGLVDEYGEAETNRAFDNTSPLRVKWVD
jgi:hypothetical protein